MPLSVKKTQLFGKEMKNFFNSKWKSKISLLRKMKLQRKSFLKAKPWFGREMRKLPNLLKETKAAALFSERENKNCENVHYQIVDLNSSCSWLSRMEKSLILKDVLDWPAVNECLNQTLLLIKTANAEKDFSFNFHELLFWIQEWVKGKEILLKASH